MLRVALELAVISEILQTAGIHCSLQALLRSLGDHGRCTVPSDFRVISQMSRGWTAMSMTGSQRAVLTKEHDYRT